MGVTYKLKQEVIELIVQKKKENSSLSCRKLEVLLQEAFNLDVSKSSINAVIKEFKLSNPVGRKPINPPKNFNIPQEKKQQLLAQVVPFLPPAVIVEPPLSEVPLQEEVLPEPLTLRKDPLIASDGVVAVVDNNPVVMPQIGDAFVWAGAKGILWEKAGLFFLWAFMQDVLGRHLVGESLAAAAGFDIEKAKILEAVVFLHIFGVSSLEELRLVRLDVLWNMLEVDPDQGVRVLDDFFGKDLKISTTGVSLEVELAAALMMAKHFKCSTQEGRTVCLSTDLTLVLSAQDQVGRTTLFKAVQEAIDQYVLCSKPLLINMLGKDILLDKEELFILSGQDNSLDKIELWAENNEKAWEYVLKAQKQRKIAAVFENKKEYLDKILFETIDNPYVYYDVYADQKYFLMEGVWTGFNTQPGWRVIIVEKDGFPEKTILLTNIDSHETDMVGVFEYFLEKSHFMARKMIESHENMGKSYTKITIINKNMEIFTITKKIFDIFEKLLNEQMCIDKTSNVAMPLIFSLSGYVQQRQKDVLIRFVIPANFPETALLGIMLKKLGHGALADQKGRKYYFSIEKYK